MEDEENEEIPNDDFAGVPSQLEEAPEEKKVETPAQKTVVNATPANNSATPSGVAPIKLDPKKVVEAALFISSRPLQLAELARFVGVAAPGYVENLVKQLASDYDNANSALKIALEPEGYSLRLRSEYAAKVSGLAQEAELSKGALKILAYISQNEGIAQSKVADKLGGTTYERVGELVEKGFLDKKKKGRSSVLSTTQKFRDYFGT